MTWSNCCCFFLLLFLISLDLLHPPSLSFSFCLLLLGFCALSLSLSLPESCLSAAYSALLWTASQGSVVLV